MDYILIVEDYVDFRFVFKKVLEKNRNESIVAFECVEKALEWLEANFQNVKAIVTDLEIKIEGCTMDGLDLAVRAKEKDSGIPVILMSGNYQLTESDPRMKSTDRFLKKAFDIDDLLALLNELVKID